MSSKQAWRKVKVREQPCTQNQLHEAIWADNWAALADLAILGVQNILRKRNKRKAWVKAPGVASCSQRERNKLRQIIGSNSKVALKKMPRLHGTSQPYSDVRGRTLLIKVSYMSIKMVTLRNNSRNVLVLESIVSGMMKTNFLRILRNVTSGQWLLEKNESRGSIHENGLH